MLKKGSSQFTRQPPSRKVEPLLRSLLGYRVNFMDDMQYAESIVKEFLLFRGFNRTLNAFDTDLTNDEAFGLQSDRIIDLIFNTYIPQFEFRNISSFFRVFKERFLSRLDIRYQTTSEKLESSVWRYYLVYAIERGRVDHIVEFFQEFGEELLFEKEDWQPWFAIPYIKKPEEHVQFKLFFSQEWLDTVVTSLHNFMIDVFSSIRLPTLLNFNEELLIRKALEDKIHRLELESDRLKFLLESHENDIREELPEKIERKSSISRTEVDDLSPRSSQGSIKSALKSNLYKESPFFASNRLTTSLFGDVKELEGSNLVLNGKRSKKDVILFDEKEKEKDEEKEEFKERGDVGKRGKEERKERGERMGEDSEEWKGMDKEEKELEKEKDEKIEREEEEKRQREMEREERRDREERREREERRGREGRRERREGEDRLERKNSEGKERKESEERKERKENEEKRDRREKMNDERREGIDAMDERRERKESEERKDRKEGEERRERRNGEERRDKEGRRSRERKYKEETKLSEREMTMENYFDDNSMAWGGRKGREVYNEEYEMQVALNDSNTVYADSVADDRLDFDEIPYVSQEVFTGHTAPIKRCRFSANGSNIATSSADGTVRIWDINPEISSNRNATICCNAEVCSIDWETKTDRLLMMGTSQRSIKIWNLDAKRVVCDISTHISFPRVVDIKCNPKEPIFVSSNASPKSKYGQGKKYLERGCVTAWSMRTWKPLGQLKVEDDSAIITSLSFNHNGKLLAASSEDGMIKLFDMTSFLPITGWQAYDSCSATCVRFGIDQSTLFTLGSDGMVLEWSLLNQGQVLSSHDASRFASVDSKEDIDHELALDSVGNGFLLTSKSSSAPLFSVKEPKAQLTIPHGAPISSVDFHPLEPTIATGSIDKTLRVTRIGK